MKTTELWKASQSTSIQPNQVEVDEVINYSDPSNLTPAQTAQVKNAVKVGAYDMAAEYVWKKTITKLKEAIMDLGSDFVAELMHRTEGNLTTESLLTEFNVINLADQLGMISRAGAMDLRQSLEQLQYYFSSESLKEGCSLDLLKVQFIIRTCVQHVLSKPHINVAIEFSTLRDMLLNDDIKKQNVQIEKLRTTSLFFIRTVCTVLSSAIKTKQGATLDHCIHNFKIIIPLVWNRLTDDDKWKIGFLYRDVVSDGNSKAAGGVKFVLSQYGGFDYVPENIRSKSFIKAAQDLIDVHYEYDNFIREPKYTKELSSMGKVIPKPALGICMSAYILVYVGNNYGHSFEAESVAYEKLLSIAEEEWIWYFDKCLPYAPEVIGQLRSPSGRPMDRFLELLRNLGMNKLSMETADGRAIYRAVILKNRTVLYDYLK